MYRTEGEVEDGDQYPWKELTIRKEGTMFRSNTIPLKARPLLVAFSSEMPQSRRIITFLDLIPASG